MKSMLKFQETEYSNSKILKRIVCSVYEVSIIVNISYNEGEKKRASTNKLTGKDMSEIQNKYGQISEGVNSACHFCVVVFSFVIFKMRDLVLC